ncbi:MAG: hypothetical protein ACO1RA_22345 [Planctomycetaceae bacterium]
MSRLLQFKTMSLLLLGWVCAFSNLPLGVAWGADAKPVAAAKWSQPTRDQVKQELERVLNGLGASAEDRREALALLDGEFPAEETLDRFCQAVVMVRKELAPLWDYAMQPTGAIPSIVPIEDEKLPGGIRQNFQLLLARTFAYQRMADESAERLQGLTTAEVVDPALLLYLRGLTSHTLLKKEECVAAMQQLLQNEGSIPRRYSTLAKLVESDIKPLEEDSLDEVSRLMDDVKRRLELGRAGKQVRDEEDLVVDKLEKMIEKMEEELKQQQKKAAGKQSGKPGSQSQPAEKSTAPEMKAPGEVDPKNIGKKEGWGNLPPKERQEVLQQIGRELPSHFRETIEEYFKRLAQDGVK